MLLNGDFQVAGLMNGELVGEDIPEEEDIAIAISVGEVADSVPVPETVVGPVKVYHKLVGEDTPEKEDIAISVSVGVIADSVPMLEKMVGPVKVCANGTVEQGGERKVPLYPSITWVISAKERGVEKTSTRLEIIDLGEQMELSLKGGAGLVIGPTNYLAGHKPVGADIPREEGIRWVGPEEPSTINIANQELVGADISREEGIRVAWLVIGPTNYMAGHRLVNIDIPQEEGIREEVIRVVAPEVAFTNLWAGEKLVGRDVLREEGARVGVPVEASTSNMANQGLVGMNSPSVKLVAIPMEERISVTGPEEASNMAGHKLLSRIVPSRDKLDTGQRLVGIMTKADQGLIRVIVSSEQGILSTEQDHASTMDRTEHKLVSAISPSEQVIQVAGLDCKDHKLVRVLASRGNLVAASEVSLETHHTWVAGLDYLTTINRTDLKLVGLLYLLLFAITHRLGETCKVAMARQGECSKQQGRGMQQFMLERLIRLVKAYTDSNTAALLGMEEITRQQDSWVSEILPGEQGVKVAGLNRTDCNLDRVSDPSEEWNLVAATVVSLETEVAGRDDASTNSRTKIKLVGILFLLLFAIAHWVEEIAKAGRQVNASVIKRMEWQEVGPDNAYANTTTVTLM